MRSIELSKVSRGFRLTGELRFICKIICTCLCVSCQYFQEVTHTCTHTHIHDCHTHIHIHIHTHPHTIFIHHSYILHTTSMISCMHACASVKIACPNRARGHLECVVLISSLSYYYLRLLLALITNKLWDLRHLLKQSQTCKFNHHSIMCRNLCRQQDRVTHFCSRFFLSLH
jgi:hypothetical protein